ncbi:cupin domain-containing protein [Lacibacter sediminis]|uniref:Cupin domain-containing protein n=1 Tax=Lacibacter sediminis TaxID=2760713 RepID=A0A7G5XKC0_9BACT|nr:hypothetical protein [Lacibacter sediminis]QNA45923.1 hypothetical protein H4075_06955 [Lacibacter sediminis]
MHYTRIYADAAGETHFEDVEIPLTDNGDIGFLSDKQNVSTMQFRENKADYNWNFHAAPAKQFIILLDGAIEITTSLGENRIFYAGEILLVEDVTGKGHKTKNLINTKRKSIFIQI